MNKPQVTRAQLERVIGRLFDEIADTKRAVASVQRAQDTKHTVLMPGEAIQIADEDGNITASIGDHASGAIEYVDGPDPNTPEQPDVDVQDGQFTVIVDGFDVYGEPAPADLSRTLVHYSREDGFTAYQGTFKGSISGTSGQKTLGVSAGIWYIRVQWETLSGKLSEPSEQVMVDVEPPVNVQDLADTLEEAEQLIDEAATEAQRKFDELKERLDNFETFDPSDLETELADIAQGLTEARQDAVDMFEQLEGQVTPQALINKLVAQEAWIGGTILKDDSVQAKHITASESLSAKIAEFLKLSVVDLIAGTGQIDDAVIQQLWVDGMVGYSATLARAVIAAPNLIPGVTHLKNGNDGNWPSGFGINRTHPSVWIQGTKTLRSATPFELVAGEEYHFSVDVQASVPGTVFYIGLVDDETGAEESGYLVSLGKPGTSWTTFESTRKITETKNYRLIFFANHTGGASNDDGYQWFRNLSMKNMTDGSLIVDDTIRTRHLHVTEDMVGRFAQFLHLVVDQIDVNKLWADQTWQGEAHFGSEDADSKTNIDGTGMLVHRKDATTGEFIPALQFGGGEFGINWYDEQTGEPTGGITNEGDITGRSFQAAHYSLDGRPIFGDPENYAGEGPILETLPKGEVAYGYRNMDGQTRSDRRAWGFLELEPFHAEAGRTYNVSLQPFRMGDTKTYFMSFNYTLDETSPHWGSPQAALYTQAGNTFAGSFRFVPETTGLVRMIVFVYTGSNGITFSTSGSQVHVTVFDEGLATRGLGLVRDATNTNMDPQPLVREYHTGWPISWWQNYSNGAQAFHDSRYVMQGMLSSNLVTSMFGGYHRTTGLVGDERGRTLDQAITTPTVLHSGTVELAGIATPQINNGYLRVHWHTLPAAPSTMQTSPYPDNLMGGILVRHGERARWDLPEEALDVIRAGQPIGFSLHPRGLDSPYFAAFASTGASGPIMRLRYTR